MTNVVVVVPTCRPERMTEWIEEWQSELDSVRAHLVIVEDVEEATLDLPDHYVLDRTTAKNMLGADSWIISWQSDGVRQLGFWYALEVLGADIVITLDDDCTPQVLHSEPVLESHAKILDTEGGSRAWQNTMHQYTSRGWPANSLRHRPYWLSHGLWRGVPDLPATLRVQMLETGESFDSLKMAGIPGPIPQDRFFPMCGMNLAFRKEIAPAMFWAPQYREWQRHGDIWAGLVAKKILDRCNAMAHSGWPTVQHDCQSDPRVNANKEAHSTMLSDLVWNAIDHVRLFSCTPRLCAHEIADAIHDIDFHSPYFTAWSRGLHVWANLMQE